MCIPDVVKNINLKAFKLISRTNETRYIKLLETCKCKYKLDASVCNNKQRWNEDKFRCECKELIDKGSCEKRFICNASNCQCDCDKLCDVGDYLDYSNYKCRKTFVDKLVEECSENIDDVKLEKIILAENKNLCKCSRTVYAVFFSIFSTNNIGIGTYFAYYKYMNPCKKTVAKEGSIFKTIIY